jgi:hypothetical protein
MSDAPRWLEQLADGSILDELVETEVEALKLPSGRVVACDPLVFLRGADPFARRVEPGTYAVSVGQIPGGENAYALLRFSKAKVARWEVARCPGEEDVEGWPGYGVDSGIGCFVDQDTVERHLDEEDAIGERVATKVAEEGVDPADPVAYQEAFQKHRAALGADPLAELDAQLQKMAFAATVLERERKGNLIAFRAGTGDGVYASFWGLDAEGRPVCLVTDFGLLIEEDEEEDLDLDEDPFAEEDAAVAVSEADLAGLEALAAALAQQEEPEREQEPSPLFVQTRELLDKWVASEKIELEPETNLDSFAEALLEKLVSLSGSLRPGSDVAEWLLERPEVADVFATDDELEADLRPR